MLICVFNFQSYDLVYRKKKYSCFPRSQNLYDLNLASHYFSIVDDVGNVTKCPKLRSRNIWNISSNFDIDEKMKYKYAEINLEISYR